MKHVMVIAGEVSSDKHGSKLIRSLKKHDLKITAIGGPEMESVADHFEENIVEKAAVGFSEVITLIPYFFKLKDRIVEKYFQSASFDHLDAIIMIDYPGFNLRIAKIAHKMGVPVFYYITPQVWAWGKSRIKILSEICERMYCVFKFEADMFNKAGGRAEFVGHPLLEDIPKDCDVKAFNSKYGLDEKDILIALLPGSREKEIKRHLPVIAATFKDSKYKLILAKADSINENLIRKYMPNVQLTEDVYTLLSRADLAVVSSGTSTLETAVMGVPFITLYKISGLSYRLARYLVKIDFISMVNILAGKQIVKELIQQDLNVKNLTKEVEILASSAEIRKKMILELNKVSSKIGSPGASDKVASSVAEFLSR